MSVPQPAPVALTAEESMLLSKINLDPPGFGRSHPDPTGDAACQLMKLLSERRAIPDVRIRYFIDPKLNIRGHGKSRKQVFESHGRSGESIHRDGNFVKYLKYFIFGPNLPAASVSRLRKVIDDDLGTNGMILDQLRRVARAEARTLSANERVDVSEEFFKLALEMGLDDGTAASVRGAVLSVR